MLAKEIMHKGVISVTPQTRLGEAARILAEHGISGAPVIGPSGGLIGMISKTDLLTHLEAARVEQAMTPWGVSLEEDTPVPDLARQMLAKKIHRIIITREGEICGIVTSLDVVRGLLKMAEKDAERSAVL